MKSKFLLLLILVVFISGCIQKTNSDEIMRKITFQTTDDVTIVGNYWSGSDTAVLLIHMMPATKESWNDFASTLNKEGMTVLAIDLRGHGESIKQNNNLLDFQKFTDEQHQSSIKDVEASVSFLKQQGVTRIYLAGASIGANLALQYQADHPDIKKSVLLSAGLNYKGVLTEPPAAKLREDQEVFLAAGTQDGRSLNSASEMAKRIASLIKGEKELKIYETSAHGTDLFNVDPNLISQLVNWLEN